METVFQIILLILIISTIGLIIGYFVGALTCKKNSSSHIIKKAKICEESAKITQEQKDLLEKEAKDIIESSNKESIKPLKEDNNKITITKKEKVQKKSEDNIDSKKKFESEEENSKNLTINQLKESIGSLDKAKNNTPDELCKIKGIGKVIERKLHNLGIYHFEQIASWGEDEIELVDKHLSFKGRIKRDKWIEQAKELAKK